MLTPLSSHASHLKRMPLRRAGLWSVLWHLASPLVLGLVLAVIGVLLYLLLHWNLWDWLKHLFSPAKPRHEISFVLVQPSDALKPKDSRLLGMANQSASGKPEPELKEVPQSTAYKEKVQPEPPLEQQPAQQPKTVQEPVSKKQPPASTLKPPATDSNPTIPLPEKTAPKPVFEQKPATENKSSVPPVAMIANNALPTQTNATETPSANNAESNPHRTSQPAVTQSEMVKTLAPFMDDLKKRLSKNWSPPRGEENRKVVVRLEIARDGNLMNVAVDKSSGAPEIDQAAVEAVEHAAPFTALPEAFSQPSVPVLFTFDYTIVGLK